MANIVITGASRGIGFETALALATSDNRIAAIARSKDGLDTLRETAIRHSPGCILHTLPFDLVHGDYRENLLPSIHEKLGQVDILINNAGALVNKPFEDTSAAEFTELLQHNFIGHVNMIQSLIPLMPPGSHIVNIGSMGGFQGSVKFSGLTAYSASKAALHALTECLAGELADKAIKINCLALGSAQTEMLAKAFPTYKSPITAAEMGGYIAGFAMTGHQFFNGKVLPVAVTTP
ncbi:SDR family NAD(P)-dependent oxidoreductase [Parapedobacter deserti]|uniref:SDR family NAD(P)-dependent oxidoreductase n=1 Tax=Parapedobacter deserti TaxID=1912957 RepID=A0ABV7JEK8_9SPHI